MMTQPDSKKRRDHAGFSNNGSRRPIRTTPSCTRAPKVHPITSLLPGARWSDEEVRLVVTPGIRVGSHNPSCVRMPQRSHVHAEQGGAKLQVGLRHKSLLFFKKVSRQARDSQEPPPTRAHSTPDVRVRAHSKTIKHLFREPCIRFRWGFVHTGRHWA